MSRLNRNSHFPGARRLHGNNARIDPKKDVTSVYLTQAISNEVATVKNVPLVDDLDVARERNWCIENKK